MSGKGKKTPSKPKYDHRIFTSQEIRPNFYTTTPGERIINTGMSPKYLPRNPKRDLIIVGGLTGICCSKC